MKIRRMSSSVFFCGVLAVALSQAPARGDNQTPQPIGVVTAVQGKVTVDHPGPALPVPVKLQDQVLFRDVIETRQESRTRALLDNESLLTVGENTKLEIAEHIYDPAENRRSVVLRLVQGKLRALVGRIFADAGNRFEIHTLSAVAAARGTHFIVWSEQGTSGVVNIGESGFVDFTSGGQTVGIAPLHFSSASPGQAPVPPVPSTSPEAPPIVAAAVHATTLPETPSAGLTLADVQAAMKAKSNALGTAQGIQTQTGDEGKKGKRQGSSEEQPSAQKMDSEKSDSGQGRTSKAGLSKTTARIQRLLDRAARQQAEAAVAQTGTGPSQTALHAEGAGQAAFAGGRGPGTGGGPGGNQGGSGSFASQAALPDDASGPQPSGKGGRFVLPTAVPITPPANISGAADAKINAMIDTSAAASAGSAGGSSVGGTSAAVSSTGNGAGAGSTGSGSGGNSGSSGGTGAGGSGGNSGSAGTSVSGNQGNNARNGVTASRGGGIEASSRGVGRSRR